MVYKKNFSCEINS